MMNGGGMGGMGGGFFGFSFIFLFLIIAIITVIFWMRKPNSYKSDKDSMETLNERLAKGEITEEEHQRLKKKLNR